MIRASLVCVQPPLRARNLVRLVSASRLLSCDGRDDDCQVVTDVGWPARSQSSAHVQQHHAGGGGARSSSSSISSSSADTSSFSLVGNIMHTGQTLDSGHYYADVCSGDRWVRVNDTSVQPMDWDPLRQQNPTWTHLAYVQVYSCAAARSHSGQEGSLLQ